MFYGIKYIVFLLFFVTKDFDFDFLEEDIDDCKLIQIIKKFEDICNILCI